MNADKLFDQGSPWRYSERIGRGTAVRGFDVLWIMHQARYRQPGFLEQLAAAWERLRLRARRLAGMEAEA